MNQCPLMGCYVEGPHRHEASSNESGFIAVEPKYYIATPDLDYAIERIETEGGVHIDALLRALKEIREVIARVK